MCIRDMVSICLEYVEDDSENIYIYASCENRSTLCDYFYKINGQIWQRHHLNRIPEKNYDVSRERQSSCLDILNKDVDKIEKVCQKYNQPMPTQFKLVYDVAKNSLDAHYEYENQYSDDPLSLIHIWTHARCGCWTGPKRRKPSGRRGGMKMCAPRCRPWKKGAGLWP